VSEELFLSKTDRRPMYLQIMEQIKLRIFAGDWLPGHALPSIRELAASTRVSVITIERAYLELEHEGLIVTQQGRGSYVAELENLQTKMKEEVINRHVEALLDTAEKFSVNENTLIKKLKAAIQKRNEPEEHK